MDFWVLPSFPMLRCFSQRSHPCLLVHVCNPDLALLGVGSEYFQFHWMLSNGSQVAVLTTCPPAPRMTLTSAPSPTLMESEENLGFSWLFVGVSSFSCSWMSFAVDRLPWARFLNSPKGRFIWQEQPHTSATFLLHLL